MARITTEQADALHALLKNVDIENAVVEILCPAKHIATHMPDDTRARLCTWLQALGYDPGHVMDVMLYSNGQLVITRDEGDDVVFPAGSFVLPNLPWRDGTDEA